MQRGTNYLTIFEIRIMRKIFGPFKKNVGWMIMVNHEVNKLIGIYKIVRFIKTQRLKLLADLHKMEEYRMVRRIFECSPMGKRSRKRSRNRLREVLEVYYRTECEKLDKYGDGKISLA
jgi:hypothetical protein